MKLRQSRIEALFLHEISNIINYTVNDPAVGFATVTDVKVSKDLSYAKVYVSFIGKAARYGSGLKALQRAKGFIRSELAKQITLRKVPELVFIRDESLEKGKQIDDILQKIKEENG